MSKGKYVPTSGVSSRNTRTRKRRDGISANQPLANVAVTSADILPERGKPADTGQLEIPIVADTNPLAHEPTGFDLFLANKYGGFREGAKMNLEALEKLAVEQVMLRAEENGLILTLKEWECVRMGIWAALYATHLKRDTKDKL